MKLADTLPAVLDGIARAARTATPVPDPKTGRSRARTACTRCGGAAAWHRTVRGRWILMEPGAWPLTVIPAGKRWRIAGDGTAVNLGSTVPSDTCRISHFDICPARPAPTGSAALLTLWRRNSRRGAEHD
ncbi:DUF6083 domain-containing protein [Streptomyces sp. NPDC057654]|uniref:DUF6083 domain-containing protein n=1 Tax=Streptomyces sp. NPDC057654 TaxID=3346196 RepID=UPI003698AA7C